MNEITHDEENSSEAEDDSSEKENVNEMQIYENNGEQNNAQEEGLITYSTDQQIFKFQVNSGTGTDQEVWGVFIDFQLVHSRWTIDAILQHRSMVFYATTENPNVMMRENHNTQFFEYIIICQNGLYIALTTPEEILYMLRQIQNIYLSSK